jgi:hypothetical protein
MFFGYLLCFGFVFRVKPKFQVWFTVKPMISGQPGRFGVGSINLDLVCLAIILINVFFGLKACLANTPLDLFWQLYSKEKNFCQINPKNSKNSKNDQGLF